MQLADGTQVGTPATFDILDFQGAWLWKTGQWWFPKGRWLDALVRTWEHFLTLPDALPPPESRLTPMMAFVCWISKGMGLELWRANFDNSAI